MWVDLRCGMLLLRAAHLWIALQLMGGQMSALCRTFGRMMLFLATEVVKKSCHTKARWFSWVGWQQFLVFLH